MPNHDHPSALPIVLVMAALACALLARDCYMLDRAEGQDGPTQVTGGPSPDEVSASDGLRGVGHPLAQTAGPADSPGNAGRGTSHRAPEDLDAGRCLVAETDSRQPDLDATAYVLLRRARAHHHTASHEAHTYCAMYVAHHPSPRQLGIRALWPEDRTPRGAQLRTALEALADARRGERPDPCEIPASDWGDRYDDARRARAAGWLEVSCGATRDLYWLARHRVAHSR